MALTNRDLAIKWGAYAAASLLLLFLHALTLRQVTLLGVMPFLPPLIVAVIASVEDTAPSVIFALAFGVCCDLTIASPLPCLYTLAFPAGALVSSLLSRRVLQPGILRSLAVTALCFATVDLLAMLALSLRGGADFPAMLSLALRELLVSCPGLLLCHPLLMHLHRKYSL